MKSCDACTTFFEGAFPLIVFSPCHLTWPRHWIAFLPPYTSVECLAFGAGRLPVVQAAGSELRWHLYTNDTRKLSAIAVALL